MSTTAYYEQVRPEQPLDSCHQLKYLLFEEGRRLIGAECIVHHASGSARYLEGYMDALPVGDEVKTELSEFLQALAKHGQLRVWIDE